MVELKLTPPSDLELYVILNPYQTLQTYQMSTILCIYSIHVLDVKYPESETKSFDAKITRSIS